MIAMEGPTTVATSTPEWRRSTPAAHPIGNLLLRHEKAGGAQLPPLDLDAARPHALPSPKGAHPPPLVSPQSVHSGPPPPYSYPSSANSSMVGLAAYLGSPVSRRASDADPTDPAAPPPPPSSSAAPASSARQSLPSISEALGKNPGALYTSPPHSASVSAPTSGPLPPAAYPPAAGLSPTTPPPRSHPDPLLPGPPNPYAALAQPPASLPPYSSSSEAPRPAAAPVSHAEWRPAAPPSFQPAARAAHDAHRPHPAYAASASPTSPHPPQRYSPAFAAVNASAGPPPPMYAPPTSHPPAPHNHRSFHPPPPPPPPPPAYSFPSPVNAPAPYTAHAAPPAALPPPPPPPPPPTQQGPPPWRPDGFDGDRRAGAGDAKGSMKREPGNDPRFGESVKRQLEIFDLETSLNEIAENSGQALDFTKHFGRAAHQAQRDPTLLHLPALPDLDDMMRRQEVVLNAFARIRGVIVSHQHALAEQQQQKQKHEARQQQQQMQQQQQQHEQQQRQQQVPPPPPQQQPLSGHASDRGDGTSKGDGSTTDKSDVSGGALGGPGGSGGGGFAGADPKKRKGRSAAPGKCHSCNRAETPEWRRGPDGARTLCNACGLHYAKITRKMGNKAAHGSSNLRPKESGGSP